MSNRSHWLWPDIGCALSAPLQAQRSKDLGVLYDELLQRGIAEQNAAPWRPSDLTRDLLLILEAA